MLCVDSCVCCADGGWTFAFADYYAMNFTHYVDTPLLQPLAKIIDPVRLGGVVM